MAFYRVLKVLPSTGSITTKLGNDPIIIYRKGEIR